MRDVYRDTVRLLLAVVPSVFRVPNFAMKGGTAINFFVRDMPRLSVDIDVAFTRSDLPRMEALAAISDGLREIVGHVKRQGLDAQVSGGGDAPEAKLFISGEVSRVTVEVNTVVRGTVLPVEQRDLANCAQKEFGLYVTAPTLAPAELYGGKLVAALDRQHPRDLFDARLLLDEEGITAAIVRCFVVYLAGHNRPIHELLAPKFKDIARAYENDFVGMVERDIPLEELLWAREEVLGRVIQKLSASERRFLLSMARGEPDWPASGVVHAEQMPALQWKLANVRKLMKANARKHEEQVSALARILD